MSPSTSSPRVVSPRAVLQALMVLGLSLLGVVMTAGSMSLVDIVEYLTTLKKAN